MHRALYAQARGRKTSIIIVECREELTDGEIQEGLRAAPPFYYLVWNNRACSAISHDSLMAAVNQLMDIERGEDNEPSAQAQDPGDVGCVSTSRRGSNGKIALGSVAVLKWLKSEDPPFQVRRFLTRDHADARKALLITSPDSVPRPGDPGFGHLPLAHVLLQELRDERDASVGMEDAMLPGPDPDAPTGLGH
jgi:hypothetical protein